MLWASWWQQLGSSIAVHIPRGTVRSCISGISGRWGKGSGPWGKRLSRPGAVQWAVLPGRPKRRAKASGPVEGYGPQVTHHSWAVGQLQRLDCTHISWLGCMFHAFANCKSVAGRLWHCPLVDLLQITTKRSCNTIYYMGRTHPIGPML